MSEKQSQKHISLTPLSSPIASPDPSKHGSETVLTVATVPVELQTALPQDCVGDPGQSQRPTMRTGAHTHSCKPASTTVGCRQARVPAPSNLARRLVQSRLQNKDRAESPGSKATEARLENCRPRNPVHRAGHLETSWFPCNQTTYSVRICSLSLTLP